jgi:glycosyltransferase involved in cell wall biosynthesis
MKILQVIPYFYPAWAYGGPPRSAYGLCKELVQRGHEVTVFTTDAFDGAKRAKEARETADGIEIRRYRNCSNYIAYHHRIFLSSGMISAMRQDLKNYDIVHLNEFRTLQNLLAHHYAKQAGVTYVIQTRGSLINVAAKQGLKSLFDMMGGRTLLRDATRLIALAPLEVEQYKSYGVAADKIDIVPNGIDQSEYANLPLKGTFRQKYGLDTKHKVILFLGRVHQTKDIDLLIKAFAGITKDFDDARLVIAGPDDGYLPALQSLAGELGVAEKVIFTGPLYGEQKLAAYTDADVYTLTSSWEAFGISVLEALACGTPVIVTDRCGIAAGIKDKAGLVVAYDAAAIKQALQTLLQDEPLRRRLGQDGKALVREKYGWGAIAEQVENTYKKCLGK